MLVVGGGTNITHVIFVTECACLIPHLHICSDWLITKTSKIQSSVWATLMKLDMWVVIGTSTTTWSVVTKCAYLIPHLHICSHWLITRKVKIQSFVWAKVIRTWYLGCGDVEAIK